MPHGPHRLSDIAHHAGLRPATVDRVLHGRPGASARAIRAVERAVAMTGNAGLARRNPLERHLRDALCGRVHTPQDDTVLLAAGRAALREKHPDAILLSAHAPEDVSALRDTIVAFFEAAMVEDVLVLPYAKQGLIGEVYDSARVLSEEYDETGKEKEDGCV